MCKLIVFGIEIFRLKRKAFESDEWERIRVIGKRAVSVIPFWGFLKQFAFAAARIFAAHFLVD
jgi:hypothetical protein